jgi:phage shock protein PspC (stress-responsive transcriptional regulator)
VAIIVTPITDDEKDTPKQDTTDPGDAPRRRLLRSRNERMLAGVAGGLADYLNLPPTLVRLGFVVAALFGGFGVLAYLVMAVIVPQDDGSGEPVRDQRPPIWAVILLGIAVLVVLPGPFWGWDHGWGWIGPLWLLFLAAVAAGVYRLIAKRWPWQQDGGPRGGGPRAGAGSEAGGGSGETATTEIQGDDAAGPRVARAIALVILAAAAIGAAFALALFSAWATATGSGAVIAGVVIALGVALAATAFFADARRSAPWLLAVALVMAVPAGAVAATDIEFDGAIGERDYTPATVTDIPADGYELGIGQLKVDLRGLPWADGTVVQAPTKLGVGQTVISVPTSVCVVGHADARAGELWARGESNAGVDPEFDRGDPPGRAPRLVLDSEVQIGQLVVTDEDPDKFDRDRGAFDDDDVHGGDDAGEAAEAAEACAR